MSHILKCIASDDEPLALRIIESYAAANRSLQLLHSFEDALSAVEYLRNTKVDLIFTDINMPDISGLDLVRALEKAPMIIFTTAHKKFAFEGFEVSAVDYLLKPISAERFSQAVNKALAQQRALNDTGKINENFLFVRSEYQLVKIDMCTIDFIEGLEDYIKINIAGSKPVLTLTTMKAVAEKLDPKKFMRIHRSYIVNLSRIKSFVNKTLCCIPALRCPQAIPTAHY